MNSTTMGNKIHEGNNVKRFREMLGIKQESLAFELGDDWNQKKISLLENKESIEHEILEQISNALKIPVEAIKNFSEEAAINIIAHSVSNYDHASGNAVYMHQPTFNALDKYLEALEEIKKLYERLLQVEKEKNELLERLANEKKK